MVTTIREKTCSVFLAPLFLALMLLGIIACAAAQSMGTLVIDTPEGFSILGETNHSWRVQVTPGVEYIVQVESATPIIGTQIVVRSEGKDIASQSFYDPTVPTMLTFRSSSSEEVSIQVSSTGVAEGSTVDDFSILIYKAQP